MGRNSCSRAGSWSVFVDGPNIDGVLGTCVLGRQPRSDERPRWNRVWDACKKWFGAERPRFVLNPHSFAANPNQIGPFYRSIKSIGFEVPPASRFDDYVSDADPVDELIKDSIREELQAIRDGDIKGVVVFAHDHGYAPALSDVLAAGGQVTIAGFREWMHSDLLNLAEKGAAILDIEYDFQAFDVELPRLYRPDRTISSYRN